MEFNCVKATERLPGDSLRFTTKSPGESGTHFDDLGRLKADLALEPPIGFEPGTPQLGIQYLNH